MLLRVLALAVLACVSLAPRAFGYSFTGTRWTGSSATLHLQLGANPAPLADGFASWGASAEDAIAIWNSKFASFRFNVVRDSTAARAAGNRVNNVHFAADMYGQAFGAGVLAVTLTYAAGSTTTETDVIFNNRLNWNSYRGPLRSTTTGQPMYDFHRVALHEFGHALGLDHPDENGQSVSALMNSRISSLDAITADDISGGQALYGTAAGAVVAPVITTHPSSVTVTAGQPATFSVVASSAAALTYQWFQGTAQIAGATNSSFTIPSATTANAGTYRATVTNSAGTVTSNAASLTVNAAPTTPTTPTTPTAPTPPPAPAPTAPAVSAPQIIAGPASQTVTAGQTASFTVTANGTAPLSYQWRKNGTSLPGATAATHTLPAVQAGDAGNYTAVVSNSAGSITSAAATLTVQVAPTIATHPASQTVALAARFGLSVAAGGAPSPQFQWFKNESAVAGATSAAFTIESARASDAGVYHATATNSAGVATSARATITVHSPPLITTAPTATTVNAGERASFSVAASGTPAPTYQWFREGAEIAGATNPALQFAAAQPSDAATYAVRVTNSIGSVSSAGATLNVKFSRLVNLSTRGFVPAGGALTPGFFIRGTEPKSLLIRAVGPTLATFGVGAALGDARLDVIAQGTSTTVASNSDWGGSSILSTAFARVGAFPLAADSKDAAVQADLPPAGYSVRIAPTGAGVTGITLAEIYDGDASSSAARLVNLSTLGFVGTGENALTAGFVISGNAPKRVLIRAIGPSLAQFGVDRPLTDPQLGLVPLGGSEPLATNDDWPDLASIRGAYTAAGAFALPAGSKDAALVITLEPGAYTVVISSVDGASTGNALVEIYDLDP